MRGIRLNHAGFRRAMVERAWYDWGTNKDGPDRSANSIGRGLADWIGVD